MTIAIKRLTSATDRTVSFGIFYAMMNVAALLSGVAIDALRLGLPHGLVGRDGDERRHGLPVRVVVASTIVTSLVAAFVAVRLVRRTSSSARSSPPRRGRPLLVHLVASIVGKGGVSRVCGASGRFRPFLAIGGSCRSASNRSFRHMDATFPKYTVRAFECSAPFGTIYAINPALIIVGVPVVASATADRRHFDVIFRGVWITAAAPFFVAASQTTPARWRSSSSSPSARCCGRRGGTTTPRVGARQRAFSAPWRWRRSSPQSYPRGSSAGTSCSDTVPERRDRAEIVPRGVVGGERRRGG